MGMGDMAYTRFRLRGGRGGGHNKYIMKKVRVDSLARDTPAGPPFHPYQILLKYLEGYQSHGAHMDASTDGQTEDAMLIAISSYEPIRSGIKKSSLKGKKVLPGNNFFPFTINLYLE